MTLRMITILMTALCVVAVSSEAEQALESMPGYFPLEELGLFEPDSLDVDVDLQGAMIEMIAGAAEVQEPELAELMAGLHRIRVRVGSIAGRDATAIEQEFERAIARLEGEGWRSMVRVDAEDAMVRVCSREVDGAIEGLTVLVNADSEEAVLVNIVGRMDPRLLGRMLASMDQLPDLDELGIELDQQ